MPNKCLSLVAIYAHADDIHDQTLIQNLLFLKRREMDLCGTGGEGPLPNVPPVGAASRLYSWVSDLNNLLSTLGLSS